MSTITWILIVAAVTFIPALNLTARFVEKKKVPFYSFGVVYVIWVLGATFAVTTVDGWQHWGQIG